MEEEALGRQASVPRTGGRRLAGPSSVAKKEEEEAKDENFDYSLESARQQTRAGAGQEVPADGTQAFATLTDVLTKDATAAFDAFTAVVRAGPAEADGARDARGDGLSTDAQGGGARREGSSVGDLPHPGPGCGWEPAGRPGEQKATIGSVMLDAADDASEELRTEQGAERAGSLAEPFPSTLL